MPNRGLLACTLLLFFAFGPFRSEARKRLDRDVEVFEDFRNGAPSESISGPFYQRQVVKKGRFPRQLESIHDNYGSRKPKRVQHFDDGYQKFIDTHFAQNYENYEPEKKPQRPKEHNRSSRYQKRPNAPPRRKQEDVEDYQPTYGGGDDYQPSAEYERIKALSEQQAKEIQENPKNCKIVTKGEMDCQVCHNPSTGAKSESCSYASKPHSQKYAYVKEKKYNSEDNPDKEKSDDKSESVEADDEEIEQEKPTTRSNTKKQQKQNLRRPRRPRIKRGNSHEKHHDKHPAASQKEETYDDFFAKYFPEYQKYQNEKDTTDDDSQYEFIPTSDNHKKDVERALAEFKTKDWSKCKKIEKDELTCYECKDEFGTEHEECMFVSHSNPKSSRLTYTENDEYHSNKGQDDEPSESKTVNQKRSPDVVKRENPEETASEPLKNNDRMKLSRKVVIKRRKLEQVEPEPILKEEEEKSGNNCENKDSDEKSRKHKKPLNSTSKNGKRTIRKKVTIKMAANKHGAEQQHPEASRTIYYEQKFEHSNS